MAGFIFQDSFIGLPYEGLSKRRQYHLYPILKGHNFIFGKGMISDDTEHTCRVAQSLIVSSVFLTFQGMWKRGVGWRKSSANQEQRINL